MKIALDSGLPAEGQFRELAEAIAAQQGLRTEAPAYKTYCECSRVIAAYDRERLVAIGGVTENPAQDGASSRFCFSVVPDYETRDIDEYMRKLLTVHA